MIKIITDSTAYFKKSDAADFGVKIVPMRYNVGGQTYFESFSDKNGNFEELIQSDSNFTTSQPNPASFLSAFEEELALDNEVLCITISSRLSGTYSCAYMAAKQTESDKICVFDSQLTAGGLYLLITKAKELIDSNMPLGEITKKLVEIRNRISVSFSVDDRAPLRNSGRIGFVRIGVGTILNIKPILLCEDGVVAFDSVARGKNEIVKKLADKIPENAQDVVINYTLNNHIASDLYNVIKEKYPNLNIRLSKIGPVLAIHLGLQAVGVSFITGDM